MKEKLVFDRILQYDQNMTVRKAARILVNMRKAGIL